MGRFNGDLPERTFQFAKAIVELVAQLPHDTRGWVLGKQLLRSGTSIGANITEADYAFSEAEFAHKCGIAQKEASETAYWLRLCAETSLIQKNSASDAVREAQELRRVLTAVVKKCQTSV